MPHAVGLGRFPSFVDKDPEYQLVLLDEPPNAFGTLREDDDHASAAGSVGWRVVLQLAEPAAAVRSPGATIEDEQQDVSIVGRNFFLVGRTLFLVGRNFFLVGRNFSSGIRQQVSKAIARTMRIGKRELGCLRTGPERVGLASHQNNFTSTTSPFSTTSVCGAISMYPSANAMLVMSPEALNAGSATPSTTRTV